MDYNRVFTNDYFRRRPYGKNQAKSLYHFCALLGHTVGSKLSHLDDKENRRRSYWIGIPLLFNLIVERVPIKQKNWNLYGLVWDGGHGPNAAVGRHGGLYD